MESNDEPIPKNKNEKKQKKKPNSDQANADTSKDGHIYGIGHPNMGKPTHDSENNSTWILTQSREGQMASKEI